MNPFHYLYHRIVNHQQTSRQRLLERDGDSLHTEMAAMTLVTVLSSYSLLGLTTYVVYLVEPLFSLALGVYFARHFIVASANLRVKNLFEASYVTASRAAQAVQDEFYSSPEYEELQRRFDEVIPEGNETPVEAELPEADPEE